jgi:hypothetical protein
MVINRAELSLRRSRAFHSLARFHQHRLRHPREPDLPRPVRPGHRLRLRRRLHRRGGGAHRRRQADVHRAQPARQVPNPSLLPRRRRRAELLHAPAGYAWREVPSQGQLLLRQLRRAGRPSRLRHPLRRQPLVDHPATDHHQHLQRRGRDRAAGRLLAG